MQRKYWWWLSGLMTLTAIVLGALQWWKFQAFGYNGLDLGIYQQTLWSLGHGHGFANSIHDPTYLGDHLELWLLPLAGLYRLWSSSLLILWTQTLVLVSAAIPVMLLFRRHFSTRVGLLAASVFLAHPLFYNVALYEFHGLAFALPLLLWSIVAYEMHRWGWWIASLIAILLVREDMPLLLAGWAGLALIQKRTWRWWAVPAILAVAYFWLAQYVISQAQPLGAYKYLAFYGWMGHSLPEILLSPFRRPLVFLQHLLHPNNWVTTFGFLIGFGLLPLAAWRYLVPVSLLYLQLMLIGADAQSILRLHYVIPYLPFLTWATIYGIKRLRQHSGWMLFDQSMVRVGVVALAIVGPLYTYFTFGPLVWPWTNVGDSGFTAPKILRQVATMIQPSDRVLTTFNYLPTFANRTTLYSLNYVYLGKRQYSDTPYVLPTDIDAAVIDWQQYYHYQLLYRETDFQGYDGSERIARLLTDQGLHLQTWIDSVAIYTRNGSNTFVPTQSFGSAGGAIPKITEAVTSATTAVQPVAETAVPDGFTEYQVPLEWLAGKQVDQPLALRFSVQRSGRTRWQSTRLLGQGWNPSFTWKPGEQWQTTYRLAIPNTALPGSLKISLVRFVGHLKLNRLRTFAPEFTKREVLQTLPAISLDSLEQRN